MLMAVIIAPCRMGPGIPMPMGPPHEKRSAIRTTARATAFGVEGSGVAARMRSVVSAPEVVSTMAPLMPLAPTSMPRMSMVFSAMVAGDR
jgi:hypothetical protein